MEKLTIRQKKILEFLRNNHGYLTAQMIGIALNISVRTVKTEVKNLMNASTEIKIESKSGRGYCLQEGKNYSNEKEEKNQSVKIPEDTENRIHYVIRKLLVVDYHVRVDYLAEELYISRSSLNQILKEVRSKLLEFQLKLVSRVKLGIIIEGNEINKRLAISEYFFHSHSQANYKIENELIYEKDGYRKEYAAIATYILDICKKYGIEMSDFSINNLVVHVNIAVRRCSFYNYTIVNEGILSEIQNTIEFKAAGELVKKIEDHYHFLLPIGENVYFAQQLKAKRIIDKNKMSTQEIKQLESCLGVIFTEINNNFGLNLSERSELYDYLFLHIPQMIMRLNYRMTIRNPLVHDHMRRYLFATKVTHSACKVIEQFYGVKVDLNEFGYLLLYFNLAITKFETNKQITIGILTGRGRPEALMYYNEISEHFSSHKYKVVELQDHQKSPKVDLIVSTYNLEGKSAIPLIVITSDHYIEQINQKINQIRYNNLNIPLYFKEEYCSFNLEGETKEMVLKKLYGELKRKEIIKEIPQEYNQFTDDELGNGIVHLQDSYRIVRKSLCYVCTLKKTIYWNRKIIRILILTKTKKGYDSDLYNLCRVVSRWANNRRVVSDFINNQGFENLIEGIRKIGEYD